MGSTTRNRLLGVVLATWLAGCAESPVMTSDETAPASGDTAAVEAVPASEVTAPVLPAPAVKPKKKFRRTKAKKEEVTVVATTANQPPAQIAAVVPLPMPKMDPVTESELKQAAQVQEAEVGIVGFLSQHMLVVISALCLAAIGFYAFVVYPARKNTNQNRFG